MIDTAQWLGAEIVTRQLDLTVLAGEAAMLEAFASALPTMRFSSATTIV